MAKIQVKLNPDVIPSGSDLAVVNSARRSFNTRSEWEIVDYEEEVSEESRIVAQFPIRKIKDKDKRLIQFLARGMTADDFNLFLNRINDHAMDWVECGGEYEGNRLKELLWQWRNTPTHESPFGHCFISFEIKIPVFLARQLVKHEFLRWSEYSRRYITDDVEFYTHEYREAPVNKKQGSGGPHPSSDFFQSEVNKNNQAQVRLYNQMVKSGIAPEQARGVLPTDLMTAVTWSGSLDAFASMCRLRLGSDAQVEAQYVAKEVYKHLIEYYPVSAKALVEGADV